MLWNLKFVIHIALLRHLLHYKYDEIAHSVVECISELGNLQLMTNSKILELTSRMYEFLK